jgi:hypothetical protein
MANGTYSIRLPNGQLLSNIPSSVTEEDAFGLATNYLKDQATITDEAKTGLKQGLGFIERTVKDTIPEYAARLMGNEEEAARQASQSEERSQKLAEETYSPFQTTSDIRNLSDAFKFASRVGTSGVVSSVPTAAAGLGAAALGAGPLTIGGTAYLASLPMSLTDTSDSFKEAGIKPEEHPKALAATVAFNNLLEFAPETAAIFRTLKKDVQKSILKRVLEGSLKTGAGEAATGGAQEATTTAVTGNINNEDFFTSDNFRNIAEAAIQEGIGGTVSGGILGTLPSVRKTNQDGEPLPNQQVSSEPVPTTSQTVSEPVEEFKEVSPQDQTNKASKEAPVVSGYKPLFAPDRITESKGFDSVTGEGDGRFIAKDKKGNRLGELAYTRIMDEGKPAIRIDQIKVRDKSNTRRIQDTAFSLMDQLHNTYKGARIESTPEVFPYKQAYDNVSRVNQNPDIKGVSTKKLKTPEIKDLKQIPVFTNNLSKMPQSVQTLFNRFPKNVKQQAPLVSSILNRDIDRSLEGKMSYQNPEIYGITTEELKTLDNDKESLSKLVADSLFQGADVQKVQDLPLSDIIGNAYDVYKTAKDQNRTKFESNLKPNVKAVFDKIDNVGNVLKTNLNKAGLKTPRDVYYIPAKFEQQDINNFIKDYTYEQERLENLSAVDRLKAFDDIRKVKLQPGKIGGVLTGALSWFNPVVNAAKNSPYLGHIQDIVTQRRDYGLRLQNKLMHMLEPVLRDYNNRDTFNSLVSILESNRLNNFKGYLDNEGKFVYKDSQGNLRRVSDPRQSQAIKQMQNIFSAILDERVKVDLAHRETQTLLRNTGLGVNPTIEQIRSVLKNQGEKLKSTDRESLEMLERYLTQMRNMKNRDYVPFTRSGTHGITVKSKKEDGRGKNLDVFVTFNMDRKGNPIKDADWVSAQEELKEFKGNPDYEISEPFELTKDSVVNKIANKEMTVDLIDQMVEIMMRNKETIGDEQANSVPMWKAMSKILVDDVLKKGFDNSLKQAQNIRGYRKNWYNILPNTIQGTAYALSNKRYTPMIRYALRQGQNVTPEEKAYAENYVESVLKPDSELFNKLRMLQFNWALGFRPSSALLQLTSFTHMMPAVLTLMTGNPIKSYALLGKSIKESTAFAKLGKEASYDVTPETIEKVGKKYGWSEDKKRDFLRAYQDGYLTQTLPFDEIGATPYDTSTWHGKLNKGAQDVSRLAGWMLRSVEEMSRMSQWLANYDALSDPKNLQRFHEMVKNTDNQYQAFLRRNNTDTPNREYLTINGLNQALALLGKEGRAPFQSTPMQFLLPFTTYPWQMFLNYYRMLFKMGPEGKKAALVASMGIISTAGIWGLPGFMLLKEGLEAALSLVFEEDIDLDREIEELGQEFFKDGDVNPYISAEQARKLTGVLKRGVVSTYGGHFLGVDLNERASFPIIGEQQINSALELLSKGEAPPNAAQGMYGVVGGSIVMAPINAMQKYTESGGSWIEAISELMPLALKDLIQSNVIEPEKGRTIAGTQVLTREDADTLKNRLIGSLGFRSREEGLRLEKALETSMIEKGIDPFKNAYAKSLERYAREVASMSLQEKQNPEAKENLNKALRKYVSFMTSKNVPQNDIITSARLIIRNAQSKAMGAESYDMSDYFKLKQVGKNVREEINNVNKAYKELLEE